MADDIPVSAIKSYSVSWSSKLIALTTLLAMIPAYLYCYYVLTQVDSHEHREMFHPDPRIRFDVFARYSNPRDVGHQSVLQMMGYFLLPFPFGVYLLQHVQWNWDSRMEKMNENDKKNKRDKGNKGKDTVSSKVWFRSISYLLLLYFVSGSIGSLVLGRVQQYSLESYQMACADEEHVDGHSGFSSGYRSGYRSDFSSVIPVEQMKGVKKEISFVSYVVSDFIVIRYVVLLLQIDFTTGILGILCSLCCGLYMFALGVVMIYIGKHTVYGSFTLVLGLANLAKFTFMVELWHMSLPHAANSVWVFVTTAALLYVMPLWYAGGGLMLLGGRMHSVE